MHLNSCTLIGRVGPKLPRLDYASSGHPTCLFTLEIDEVSRTGEVFTLFVPVEIWGQAEHAAELLEPGDEIMLSGRLKYKSQVDAKTQIKTSKLIISSWGISQRQPTSMSPEYDVKGDHGALLTEAPSVPEPEIERTRATKARRRRPVDYIGKASALRE